jgi:glycosyltransferase involved in cell wall biosynthesis
VFFKGSWQYKAVIAAFLARKPVVWHLNDTLMPFWIKLTFSFVQRLATGFIFASKRSEEYYQVDLSGRASFVVPSAIDFDRFARVPEDAWEPDELAKYRDKVIVGTVANISPVKDLGTLLRAFASAYQVNSNLRLLVVGPVFKNQRTYHSGLVQLASRLGVADEVIWAGGQEKVEVYLAKMDMYVCSSVAESSPIAVWEAMAAGLPVISTDVGDVPLHIIHGESGFIVRIGDDEQIARLICDLAEQPKVRQTVGVAAQFTAQQFSKDIISQKTYAAYQNVLYGD